jgi:hypothetical protein
LRGRERTNPPSLTHEEPKRSLIRTILVNVAIVLAPVAIYYFAVVDRQMRYEVETSFRALAEIETQLNNELKKPEEFFSYLPPIQTGEGSPTERQAPSGGSALYGQVFEPGTSKRDAQRFLQEYEPLLKQHVESGGSIDFEDLLRRCLWDSQCAEYPSLFDDLHEFIRVRAPNARCEEGCLTTLRSEVAGALGPDQQDRKVDSEESGRPAPTDKRHEGILRLLAEPWYLSRLSPAQTEGCEGAAVLAVWGEGSSVGVVRCTEDRWTAVQASLAELVGVQNEQVDRFHQLLVTTETGLVLAEVTPGSARRIDARSTHTEIRVGSSILSLADLFTREALLGRLPLADKLSRAPGEDLAKQIAAKAVEAAPTLPVAREFTVAENLAGNRVRFFVRPTSTNLPCPECRAPAASSAATRDVDIPRVQLVLVGVRQEGLLAEATKHVGPGATLWGSAAVALLLLGWPLLRIGLQARRDSLLRREVRAAGVAALLLTALGGSVFVSSLSRQAAFAWATQDASDYADRVRDAVGGEVRRLAAMLSALEGYSEPAAGGTGSGNIEDRRREEGRAVLVRDLLPAMGIRTGTPRFRTCQGVLDSSETPLVWSPAIENPAPAPLPDANPGGLGQLDDKEQLPSGPELPSKPETLFVGLRASGTPTPIAPRFLHVFRTSDKGSVDAPTMAFFTCRPPAETAPIVEKRAYFGRIRDGEAWPTSPMPAGRDGEVDSRGMTAQRLFNLLDGRKLLQVAIPRADSAPEQFTGIVSGDSFVYSLSTAVPVGYYRFAVFEEATGTVLFHDDDSRSLLENVFEEAERDAGFLEAVGQRTPARLAMRYHGRPHRGVYAPIEGMPWGVVALYPTAVVDEAVPNVNYSCAPTTIGFVHGSSLIPV